ISYTTYRNPYGIRKIVEQNKNNFHVFGRSTDTNGFIDQLEQMATELKRYDITQDNLLKKYDDLKNRENKGPQELVLQEKLHDLSLVYE
ncbi:hypothetical protein, partial [Pseudomonas sp. 2822-17]|uniref:hypothetical protein n=1 Tax=Pseudomonas sp. 2822-17 TaxID=1712678 RepID=UPI001C447071